MAKLLLREIRDSGLALSSEKIATVELGAGTMLPSLAVALNYD
jgi:hypothetical protein